MDRVDLLITPDTPFANVCVFLARAGFNLIPRARGAKRPAIAWKARAGAPLTPDAVAAWTRRTDGMSVLCEFNAILGATLVVVDADDLASARALAAEARAETMQIETSRGVHYWLLVRDPPPRKMSDAARRIDVIAHALAVAPGSRHPSGARYRLASPASIVVCERLSDVFPSLASPAPARRSAPHASRARATTAASGTAWVSARIRALMAQVYPDARPASADGRWWSARCPFHADREPSAWIDVLRGVCGCYAGCRTRTLEQAARDVRGGRDE
jgi:hypothetical protein